MSLFKRDKPIEVVNMTNVSRIPIPDYLTAAKVVDKRLGAMTEEELASIVMGSGRGAAVDLDRKAEREQAKRNSGEIAQLADKKPASETTVGGFAEAMRKTLGNYVFNIAKLEEDAARVKEQLRQLYLSARTASTALGVVIDDPALTESELGNAKQALADYEMQVNQFRGDDNEA